MTTTKLARALWIVLVTFIIAVVTGRKQRSSSKTVKWPWFIIGFLLVAALATWVPALASVSGFVVAFGRRALVLALFRIGLALSHATLRAVGARPLVLGV